MMPVIDIKKFFSYDHIMSFLIVFNGQFSPLTHPTSPRGTVSTVNSAESSGEVKEFKEFNEKKPEDKQRSPPRKFTVYEESDRNFQEQKKRSYARDIMSAPVKFVSSTMPVAVAKEMMEKHQFRHLPVLDDNYHLQGMLSDRELGGLLENKTCHDVMSNKIIVALDTASINEIAIILLQEKINALPIINHKRELVGIITHSDILKYIIESTPFLSRI
jgi:CBS domain-containing protein